MKIEQTHADALGRSIQVGDYVAYPSGNCLLVGRVTRLTAKMIIVIRSTSRRSSETRKYPQDTVLLEKQHVMSHLLKQL
jgi:hypothetical protein